MDRRRFVKCATAAAVGTLVASQLPATEHRYSVEVFADASRMKLKRIYFVGERGPEVVFDHKRAQRAVRQIEAKGVLAIEEVRQLSEAGFRRRA